MQRPRSSNGNGFDSTPPMSASSSMSTASTAHSVFYPNMSNGGQYQQQHSSNGGQPIHLQIRVSPSDGTGVGGVFHEIPQGRFVYPGQSSAMTDRQFSMSGSPGPDDGPYMPISSSTHATPFHSDMTSPSMGNQMSMGYHPYTNISPTDEMRQHQHTQQQYAHQTQQMAAQQRERGRPMLMPRHSMPGPPPQFGQLGSRPPIQRHMSLSTQAHQPARSASPHLGPVGDVFDANPNGSPVRRPLSSLGLPLGQLQEHPSQYDQTMNPVSHSSLSCQVVPSLTVCRRSKNNSLKASPHHEHSAPHQHRPSALASRLRCAHPTTRGPCHSSLHPP